MGGPLQRLWHAVCRRAGGRLKTLGSEGERLAARLLSKQGYHILHRNLKVVDDEADLVALAPDGQTIVIVEVKARGHADGAPLQERVGPMKQAHLTRLALRLQTQERYRDRPFRIDVITVEFDERGTPNLRHFPNACDSAW